MTKNISTGKETNTGEGFGFSTKSKTEASTKCQYPSHISKENTDKAIVLLYQRLGGKEWDSERDALFVGLCLAKFEIDLKNG